MRFQHRGLANVALAERRVLAQLPEAIAIALRRGNRSAGFNDKQAIIFIIKLHLVSRTARHNDIIAVRKAQRAVHGAHRTRAFVNKDHLVGVGIFEKIIVRAFSRRSQRDFTIIIHQNRLAALEIILFRIDLKTLQAAVLELFVQYDFWRCGIRLPHLHDLRWRIGMVE